MIREMLETIDSISVISAGISLLVSYFVAFLTFCASFYVHEGGHLISGTIYKIILGNPQNISFSTWIECYSGLYVPQQTLTLKMPIVALSGPLTVVLVSFLLAFLIKKIFKTIHSIALFLIPSLITVHEIIDNILLGTDNPTFEPLYSFPLIKGFINSWLPAMLIIPIAAILCGPVKKLLFLKCLPLIYKFISFFWSKASEFCHARP